MKKDMMQDTPAGNIKWMLSILVCICLLHSCDSYVEVEQPNSQLTGSAVFEDVGTVNAAMTGLYAKMRNNGVLAGNSTGGSLQLGWYADEFENYQAVGVNNFYNNTLFDGESVVGTIWNQSYRQIYEANAIIEGVTNSVSLPEASRNQFKGEALFVRALVHLYLVNLYGDVPYIKTTDPVQNSQVSRMASATVYENIIADLEEAQALLPETYITAERVRPNRFAAMAVLARAYLYTGAYAEASDAASAVINSPLYTWETDLDKVFLKASTTTIWQFMPNAAGTNTSEGGLYIFVTGPPTTVGLRADFVNAFAANDQRKVKWVKAVTAGTNTWYHAFKYKQRIATASSLEYSVVLRLAEQYLIRAEARAKQGELTNAKQDLNLIRNTAGLGNTTAVNADEIVAEVLNQRRFELFSEFGHRFFDLKRTAQLNTVLPLSKPGWNANDALWPLPATELIANPNLNPQNTGY
ncbi:RagB/SusD family nutrient uptake outer membrane protein [Flavobacterium sp. 102]|uniref:RagB/SusD family nutrient uptake outer membrane protein n=1 Tax=Flavobacterium sp. 102 TaxID=2135623 RepID=UPI000F2444CA|nr:RagB/SusD family nutrient uptake outer membrane protein [Flavobacterium sp. 102]RKS03054.1 RagB/SusD domain-containing protein [Flavobacterium sp. 102]